MTDPTPAPAAQPAPAAPLSESDDKLWASLAHLGGILYILPSLIIYLVLKGRGPKVTEESRKALNWQITFMIVEIVLWILSGILTVALAFTAAYGIGILFYWLPLLWWLVNVLFSVLGFVKVNGGGAYKYPFSFNFIK